jgi:outer membrane protein OmpA-like peptidoglycan-associated protein
MKKWTLILLALLAGPVLATDTGLRSALKEQVFDDANAALANANAVSASILTPETYRRAGEIYKRADAAFARGADVDRVQAILKEGTLLFNEAAIMAPTVEQFVSDAYQARQDAMEADAEKRASDLWLEAERQFYEATSRAEKGREGRVARYADKAEELYRSAELAAIETVLFQEIDAQIARAKKMDADDWAPQSYQKAIDLLAEARAVLAANRYDTDEPRNLARQAMHNALHAQYVSGLADAIDDNDTTLEAVLLEWEAVLQPLGESLDVPMYFDEGPQHSIALVTAAIEDRTARLNQLSQEVGRLNQRVVLLQEELLVAQSELENSAAAQSRLDRRLAAQEEQEQTLKRVERLFNKTEAEVVRAENRLVIRLVGLGFASGSAKIEARHEALLQKLMTAIAEFPDASLTIEGHTDSYGADDANLTLSVKRAEAVSAYLMENGTISPTQLSSVGFGETRPIANNETPDGRRKNRRIDVIVYPSWWSAND